MLNLAQKLTTKNLFVYRQQNKRMKKISLIFISILSLMLWSKNAKADSATTITGETNVCAGGQLTYSATCTNNTKYAEWFVYGGVFASTGTQNSTRNVIPFSSNNVTTDVVIWNAGFNGTGYIQVRYKSHNIWGTLITVGYEQHDVNVGITNPTTISGPSSICVNSNRTYNFSCPAISPSNSYYSNFQLPVSHYYEWASDMNGVMSAWVQTTSPNINLVCSATNNLPIHVSVRYRSGCGTNIITSVYTITVPRISSIATVPTSPPSYVVNATINAGKKAVTFTFPSYPTAYTWTSTRYSSTATSPTQTGGNGGSANYIMLNGDVVNIGYSAINDCGSNASFDGFSYKLVNGNLVRQQILRTGHPIQEDETIVDQNFNFFPNPAKDNLNIYYYSEGLESNMNITITDVIGNIVVKEQQSLNEGENNLQINVSELSNGIYFLNVDSKGFSQKKKIVIEK